jgi:hypothetical protein
MAIFDLGCSEGKHSHLAHNIVISEVLLLLQLQESGEQSTFSGQ